MANTSTALRSCLLVALILLAGCSTPALGRVLLLWMPIPRSQHCLPSWSRLPYCRTILFQLAVHILE